MRVWQALADLQHAKQDSTVLRMRERNVRERMERGHGVLRAALRLNHDVGLDLASLLAETEASHTNLFLSLHRAAPPAALCAWPPPGVQPLPRNAAADGKEVDA